MENDLCSKCEYKYSLDDRVPDCSQCPFDYVVPVLCFENELAFKVWVYVYNQAIVSFNGAITLNICAIKDILDLMVASNSEKLTTIRTILDTWEYFNNKNKEKVV